VLNESERQEFGAYLRRLRERAGKSLRDVQREMGTSPAYLAAIEKGLRNPPQPDYLQRLARCYRVPSLDLMRRAGHLETAPDDADRVRWAYETMLKDPDAAVGHSLEEAPSLEIMRHMVLLYERLSGKRLLTPVLEKGAEP